MIDGAYEDDYALRCKAHSLAGSRVLCAQKLEQTTGNSLYSHLQTPPCSGGLQALAKQDIRPVPFDRRYETFFLVHFIIETPSPSISARKEKSNFPSNNVKIAFTI
jgi:hypothetical protein